MFSASGMGGLSSLASSPIRTFVDVHLLQTKVGNKIVATFWKHPFARLTLLYSHGNAADLDQTQEPFIELGAYLRVNVMSYDYSGYAASSNKVSKCKPCDQTRKNPASGPIFFSPCKDYGRVRSAKIKHSPIGSNRCLEKLESSWLLLEDSCCHCEGVAAVTGEGRRCRH